MDAELHDGTRLEFPEGTSPEVIQATVKRVLAEKYPPSKAPASIRDTAVSLAQGVVGAGKSLSDVFGADTALSGALGNIQQSLGESYTPERQAELQRRAVTTEAASKSGSAMEEISAFLGGVKEAPLQSLMQGIGSLAPYVATGLVGLGAKTVTAVNTLVGLAQGTGTIKGTLYDNVKAELIRQKVSPAEAEARAAKAQETLGENFLNIAAGAMLGAAGARFGVESLLSRAGAAKANAKLLPRVGTAVLGEAPLEAAQAGQEQYASNIALQREGIDTPAFQGVLGAAARDAAIGAMTAGTVGAVRGPGAPPSSPGTQQGDGSIEAIPQEPIVPVAPPVAEDPLQAPFEVSAEDVTRRLQEEYVKRNNPVEGASTYGELKAKHKDFNTFMASPDATRANMDVWYAENEKRLATTDKKGPKAKALQRQQTKLRGVTPAPVAAPVAAPETTVAPAVNPVAILAANAQAQAQAPAPAPLALKIKNTRSVIWSRTGKQVSIFDEDPTIEEGRAFQRAIYDGKEGYFPVSELSEVPNANAARLAPPAKDGSIRSTTGDGVPVSPAPPGGSPAPDAGRLGVGANQQPVSKPDAGKVVQPGALGLNQPFVAGNRVMAITEVNGVRVPFYLSTGSGGKANVPAGKWYPFFGVGSDGWLNKGSEEQINDFYGSAALKAKAEELNNLHGDIRERQFDNTLPSGAITDVNEGLAPTKADGSREAWKNNIHSLLTRINKAPSKPNVAKPATKFIPTYEYQEVPEGAVMPPGLQYELNQTTQKNYARLPPRAAGLKATVVKPTAEEAAKQAAAEKQKQKGQAAPVVSIKVPPNDVHPNSTWTMYGIPKEYEGLEIPSSLLAKHAKQLKINHDQDLATIEKRGGLTPSEAYFAILDSSPYTEEAYATPRAMIRAGLDRLITAHLKETGLFFLADQEAAAAKQDAIDAAAAPLLTPESVKEAVGYEQTRDGFNFGDYKFWFSNDNIGIGQNQEFPDGMSILLNPKHATRSNERGMDFIKFLNIPSELKVILLAYDGNPTKIKKSIDEAINSLATASANITPAAPTPSDPITLINQYASQTGAERQATYAQLRNKSPEELQSAIQTLQAESQKLISKDGKRPARNSEKAKLWVDLTDKKDLLTTIWGDVAAEKQKQKQLAAVQPKRRVKKSAKGQAAADAKEAKRLAKKEADDAASAAAFANEIESKKAGDEFKKLPEDTIEEDEKDIKTLNRQSFAALDKDPKTDREQAVFVRHVAFLLGGGYSAAKIKAKASLVTDKDIEEAQTLLNKEKKGASLVDVRSDRDVRNTVIRLQDELSDANDEDAPAIQTALGKAITEAKTRGINLTRLNLVHTKHIRKSQGEAAEPTGNTRAAIISSLKATFKTSAGFDNLVTVVQEESELPPDVLNDPNYKPGTRGVAYEGKVYLVADNIPQGRELGVLLHEAGAHIGFDRILSDDARGFLADKVRQWSKEGDVKGTAAKEALRKGGTNDDEIIAYMVEELVNAGVTPTSFRPESGWLRRVYAAFNKFLKNVGMRGDIAPQDLVDAAFGAAHLEMNRGELTGLKFRTARALEAQKVPKGEPAEPTGNPRAAIDALLRRVSGEKVTKFREAAGLEPTEKISRATTAEGMEEVQAVRDQEIGAPKKAVRLSVANPAILASQGTANYLFRGPSAPRSLLDRAAETASGVRQNMVNRLEWWMDKATRVYGNAATTATGEAALKDRIEAGSKVTHIALNKLLLGGLEKKNGFWQAVKTDASYQDMLLELQKAVGKYDGVNKFEDINRLFDFAATARREQELIKAGKMAWQTPEGIQPTLDAGTQARGVTPQIDEGMRLYNGVPEIKTALDIFEKFNNRGVDAMVTAGVIDAPTAAGLKGNAGYVPWFRISQDKDGNIKIPSPRDYAKGLVNLSNLRDLEGAKIEKFQINHVLENMAQLSGWMTSKTIGNDTAAYMVDFATKFGIAGKPFAKKVGMAQANSVQVMENGVPTYYAFDDPMAIPAFRGYESAHSAITQVLAAPANLVRLGVTAFPVFSVSQLPQDAMRAFIESDLKNPYALIPRIMGNFVKELFGGGTDAGKRLAQFGIVGRGGDIMPGEASRSVRQKLGHYDSGMGGTAKKFWAGLERIQAASDAASRTALYELTMKETGNEALAIRKAREIINFDTQGVWATSTFLRQTVPFMGVTMVGLNNLYKGLVLGQRLSDKEASAARRTIIYHGTQIAVLTMLYTMLVGDTDDYKKLGDTKRNRSFIIPGTGMGIPVPGDGLGYIFKVIPEQITRYTLAEGLESKDAGSRAGRALWEGFSNIASFTSFIPVIGSPLPKTYIELTLNQSHFTGNPIVGKSKEHLDPADQYTDSTSEIAKQLGKAMNLSPLKLDYIVRAMSGQMGGFVMAMADAAVNSAQGKVTPSWNIQSFPGLNAFTYPDGKDRAALEDFYELRGLVDKVARTYTGMASTGRGKEALAYLAEGDNKRAYALRQFQTQAELGLAKFRRVRTLIINDPNITDGAEMKRRLKELDDRENAYLKSMRLPDKREFAHLTPSFDPSILKAFR